MPVLPPPPALAKVFSQKISECLTPEELAEVNRLNFLPYRDTFCATSDLIDSNQCMADALEAFGLEFHPDLIPLINESWGLARDARFIMDTDYKTF